MTEAQKKATLVGSTAIEWSKQQSQRTSAQSRRNTRERERSPIVYRAFRKHYCREEGCQQIPRGHCKGKSRFNYLNIRKNVKGTNRMIFQSSREAPGGGTAALPICARPSVFTHVAIFSVYAAAGRHKQQQKRLMGLTWGRFHRRSTDI